MKNIESDRELLQNRNLAKAKHAVVELQRVLNPLLDMEKSRLEQKLAQLEALQESLTAKGKS